MKRQKNAMRYDIMTSCDSNLLKYVAVQLYSISVNLKNSFVHFYLFHRDIPAKDLQPLEALCHQFGNISFHTVKVPESEKYDILARHGGGWCGEAYYSLCSHILLPEHVKRVLYIDAGDIIFTGNIVHYYNSNFEGKALICTSSRFEWRDGSMVPFEETNFDTPEGFMAICRGLFNSGSYLINLDKLRDAQLTIDDWLDFSQSLCELSGKQDTSHIYWGDQGLLSAAFADDLKFYGFPQDKKVWLMPYIPYNFYIGYYNNRSIPPDYQPAVVHFTGGPKPWKMRYPGTLDRFSSGEISFETLKEGQAQWYNMWYEYAASTDQLLKKFGY